LVGPSKACGCEHVKLAIDVINGSPLLREWMDDAASTPQDLDALAMSDEYAWLNEREALALLKSRLVIRS
jgi:hypothetical protein